MVARLFVVAASFCTAVAPEIRNHAYVIYVARRDDKPGSDLKDWLAAETIRGRRVKVP